MEKKLALLRGSTNTASAQWKRANTAAGLHCKGDAHTETTQAGWWTSKYCPGVISTARSTLSEQEGPLPPSSPRGTDLGLKRETHRLLSALATASPSLRLSWKEWCSLQPPHCKFVFKHLPQHVFRWQQMWNPWEIKTKQPPRLPSKSVGTSLQCLYSNRGTPVSAENCFPFYSLYHLLQNREFGLWHLLR